MRLPLPNLAMTSDGHDISYRAAAAVARGLLNDFDIIHDVDTSKVVDRNKVTRERKKLRQVMSSSQQIVVQVHCFFMAVRTIHCFKKVGTV